MAGHKGIEGNEAADKEAKLAVEGKSSFNHFLPLYLRKLLPINASAVKQAYQMELKKKWVDKWRSLHRGSKIVQLDETLPSNKFLKSISQKDLSCYTASHIVQLRLIHIPVNQYLHHIGSVMVRLLCHSFQQGLQHSQDSWGSQGFGVLRRAKITQVDAIWNRARSFT